MLRGDRGSDGWKPWLQKTYDRSSSSTTYKSLTPREKPKGLVLFVRIAQEDKSEMFTLRDLHDGIKIYEVKCNLELHSGIPTNFMEMRSIHNTTLEDDTSLVLGNNVSFGETIRMKLNETWNEAMDAVWRGSISNLKRYLRTIAKKSSSDLGAYSDLYVDEILSQALFIACRYRDTKICSLLLKIGANAAFTTVMGNTCLHVASHAGHLPLVQLLVTYGSNIRCRNIRGASSLEVATDKGHFDCARWLWLNQWSASITTERLRAPSQVELRQQSTAAEDGNFVKQPQNKRPITAEVKPASWNSLDKSIHFHNNQENRRPQTAVYTRQLKTLDSKLPHRTSSRFKSKLSSCQTPDIRRRIALNGLPSDKTKTILAYFASKKEHQKSIPGKDVDFDASITNASASWSKHSSLNADVFQRPNTASFKPDKEAMQKLEATPPTQLLWDTKVSTRLNESIATDSKPHRTAGSHIKAEVIHETSFAATPQYVWETEHSATAVDVTSSLPKPILLPFNETNDLTRSETAPSLRNDGDKARTGTFSRNTAINFTMPKVEQESQSDLDRISCDDGGYHTARLEQAVVSNDCSRNSPATNLVVILNPAKSNFTTTEQSSPAYTKQCGGPPSNEIVSDCSSNEEKKQPKTDNEESKLKFRRAIVHIPTALTENAAKPNSSSPLDSSRKFLENMHDPTRVTKRQVSGPKNIAHLQPRPSPRLQRSSTDLNEAEQSNAHVEGQLRSDKGQETRIQRDRTASSPKLISRRSTNLCKNQTTAIKSGTSYTDQRSSVDDEAVKAEKNRKAFETWLTKKRKAVEKRKDDENKQRIHAASKRISSGLTFEEWLRIKKEEETEDDQMTNRHDATAKIRKRELRREKTYEDWVKEKEEERQNRLDHQRILEEQTQLKAQEQLQKKKQEYEKKRAEWLKKKVELRKLEQEQKREKELIDKEIACMEQQERLENRKVKTFEEWASAKEEISKLNRELSKAEKDALAQKEKEDEDKRKVLAKKKFKLWVKKKDQKKLEEAERELAQARERTMLLKIDTPPPRSTPRNSNSFHTSDESQDSDQDIDNNHNFSELDEDSFTADDSEDESVFQISVQITRKSIDGDA